MGAGVLLGGGMAHIRRLIYFFVGFAFAAVAMVASAQESIPAEWRTNGDNVTVKPTAQESCDRFALKMTSGQKPGVLSGTVVDLNIGPFGSYVMSGLKCHLGTTSDYGYNIAVKVFACGEGYVRNPVTGACEIPECPEGQVRNPITNNCQEPCPAAGTSTGRSYVNWGGPLCTFGCERTREAHKGGSVCALVIDVENPGGEDRAFSCDYAYTGNFCGWSGEKIPDTENIDETPPKDEKDCGPGYQSGTVNGEKVCLKEGPPVDTKDIKETKKPIPEGGTEEVIKETNTIKNPDGTITRIINTTRIIRNEAGEEVGRETDTKTDTQGAGGFCEENPTAGVCGAGGGMLKGVCLEGGGVKDIACEGDAIQCAIREETMRTACALAVSKEVRDEWQAIKEFDGTGEGEGLDRRKIDVTDALDVTMQGGGGGLQDQSFVVFGKTILIPFSKLNLYLDIFGYAVLAIAWLQAFRILAGVL